MCFDNYCIYMKVLDSYMWWGSWTIHILHLWCLQSRKMLAAPLVMPLSCCIEVRLNLYLFLWLNTIFGCCLQLFLELLTCRKKYFPLWRNAWDVERGGKLGTLSFLLGDIGRTFKLQIWLLRRAHSVDLVFLSLSERMLIGTMLSDNLAHVTNLD